MANNVMHVVSSFDINEAEFSELRTLAAEIDNDLPFETVMKHMLEVDKYPEFAFPHSHAENWLFNVGSNIRDVPINTIENCRLVDGKFNIRFSVYVEDYRRWLDV